MYFCSIISQLRAIPVTCRELCDEWLPRPIHDAAVNAAATGMIDALAGFPLNPDQEDCLDAVSHFVAEYEGGVEPQISGLDPPEAAACGEQD